MRAPVGVEIIKRSKLEIHVDILRVLARYGPSKITQIMRKVNICFSFLKQYLDFLIQQNLVEEEISHKTKPDYAITEKGLTVIKRFRELNSALPIIEEA